MFETTAKHPSPRTSMIIAGLIVAALALAVIATIICSQPAESYESFAQRVGQGCVGQTCYVRNESNVDHDQFITVFAYKKDRICESDMLIWVATYPINKQADKRVVLLHEQIENEGCTKTCDPYIGNLALADLLPELHECIIENQDGRLVITVESDPRAIRIQDR